MNRDLLRLLVYTLGCNSGFLWNNDLPSQIYPKDMEKVRLQKEVDKKLSRFDGKKTNLAAKTLKLRAKLNEELEKINTEAIQEEAKIEKQKEELRMKLEKDMEVKLGEWLKKRSAMVPSIVVTISDDHHPIRSATSQDYIDLEHEDTSPTYITTIAWQHSRRKSVDSSSSSSSTFFALCSIRGENLLTQAPQVPQALSGQGQPSHDNTPRLSLFLSLVSQVICRVCKPTSKGNNDKRGVLS